MFAASIVDPKPMQNFRCITPLNITMDTNSSPITFLNASQEEWLDVDELSPSLQGVCLQDVEAVDLIDSGQRHFYGMQTHDDQGHEVPIPSEIPYPANCNTIQNTMEYINTAPSPLFNFSVDMFDGAEFTCYDSAVESLSECSSLSGWSDSESKEFTKQICFESGERSLFTFSTNPIDEGYHDSKDTSANSSNISKNTSHVSEGSRQTKKSDAAKHGLKRPKNGFIRFAMKFRKNVAEEHPNLDNREISRILGVRWRKLSMREKYAYESEFHKEMADRKRSHPDWKYGGSRLTHELHPMEPIPSRLRPRETLKRRAIPRLTRPYRRRKLQPSEEAQRWVQCDRCNKWRKLPKDAETNLLPEKWFCEMNTSENDCSYPETFTHHEGALLEFDGITIKNEPIQQDKTQTEGQLDE